MRQIQVLDCTLRDGGYCNQWKFGRKNITKIINGLMEAGIDIIECGFLTNKVSYEEDATKYTTIQEIAKILPENRNGRNFVCMVNYGEYDLSNLPQCDGTSIDGLRVAFHKKDSEKALEFCKGIQDKGYKVFIQAMVSLNYTDEEFLALIAKVNMLHPYAFYIVDSFGVMKRKEMTRLFYMVEHNLADDIVIGFHSHNNMQLAYSNAQTLVDLRTKRNLVIDASVMGMGRGAGNLNTELFLEYLNDNIGTNFDLKPLLHIIDEILNRFYQQNQWGYSLPNYLSAKHNAHPSYAEYLDARKTLTVDNMDDIFSMMEEDKKAVYDKEYISNTYMRYMEIGQAHEKHRAELAEKLRGKTILLIAPGKSVAEEKAKVKKFAEREDVVSIGINSDRCCPYVEYIFLSNLRRFRELEKEKREKCIVTSNIPAEGVYLQVQYRDLVNHVESVRDNAGMMAVCFCKQFGVEAIYLAGFDGYSHDLSENYGDKEMIFLTKNDLLDEMNAGMSNVLTEYAKNMKIYFLTAPRYVFLENQEQKGEECMEMLSSSCAQCELSKTRGGIKGMV